MRWCQCFKCSKEEQEETSTLDFTGCSLSEVPSMVFNYERTLQHLLLDNNKITELPRTLFQCEELQVLGLSDNEIEQIPQSIEKLKNLEHLHLSKNYQNSLPRTLHHCRALKALHLSSNDLRKVPSPITRVINLKELYLNNCDLNFVPANLCRLTHLRILELRENGISTLPKAFKTLSDLKRLDISCNKFSAFPEVIGSMVSITELWINDNEITEIPNCIGNLLNLAHLDASCNQLVRVDDHIDKCTQMVLLVLSHNDLQHLPDTLGKLTEIRTLKVDHNVLDILPQNIGRLVNLEELDVQFNKLNTFPSTIGMLRKLNTLVAANNCLTMLPIEIGSCTSLTVLSLHNNLLTHIPEEIGHLTDLSSVSLINNRLYYLPITILSLTNLKALWLSHNQSQPLITMQKDTMENGQVVLTCVFLPQQESSSILEDVSKHVANEIPSTGRRIGFKDEPHSIKDTLMRLNRIPTPHPKAFVKYQKILAQSRKNAESGSQNIALQPLHVKEASIVAMKPNNAEPEHKDINHDTNGNRNSDTPSDLSIATDNSGIYNLKVEQKPRQPPPYHIAATYSKSAHLFAQSEPQCFTQNQPTNIVMPKPMLPTGIDNSKDHNLPIGLKEAACSISSFLILTNYEPVIQEFLEMKHFVRLKQDDPRIAVLSIVEHLLNPLSKFQLAQIKYIEERLEVLSEHIKISNSYFENKQLNNHYYLLKSIGEILDVTVEQTDLVYHLQQMAQSDKHLPYFYTNPATLNALTTQTIRAEDLVCIKHSLVRVTLCFINVAVCGKNEYHSLYNNFLELLRQYEQKSVDKVDKTELVIANNQERKGNKWIFGVHQNPKIITVELTPCCYVLGFTVKLNKDGVFVNEVDINGNAHMKLFPGDKIIMLDDRDISKMVPEEAAKAVQVWGPETENFLISRN